MAYVECPDCRMTQQISDEATDYQCFTCFAEHRFFRCPNCETAQTIAKRWRSFTCAKCRAKVDVPTVIGFSQATKANQTTMVGGPYPP
jgi:hypothetical protein